MSATPNNDVEGMVQGLAERTSPGAMVSTGPESQPVWQGLRDLWLANAVMAHNGTSEAAAYRWQASDYVPLLFYGQNGEPKMAFARSDGDADADAAEAAE